MTELVRPEDIAALPIEQRGQVITRALEESKSWLAVATKGTDPTPIAEFKAWAATVAEMTRQKGLAEDIQLDALEMVRRAERGIGVAIRNGQAAGEIRKHGDPPPTPVEPYERIRSDGRREVVRPRQAHAADSSMCSTTSFGLRSDELARDIYPITDGVSDDEYEVALAEARVEKKLTRANIIRKIRSGGGSLTRVQKAERIRAMAAEGYSSRQMSGPLAVRDVTIREIARDHDIDIPADRVTRHTRRDIDPHRVVSTTADSLAGIAYSLKLLTAEDYDQLDLDDIRHWLPVLEEGIHSIRKLNKELMARAKSR